MRCTSKAFVTLLTSPYVSALDVFYTVETLACIFKMASYYTLAVC